MVKNLPANAGDVRDVGSVTASRRSPGERHGIPLQYSFLENHMERGAWLAMAPRVARSWTQLMQLSTHTHTMSNIGMGFLYPCLYFLYHYFCPKIRYRSLYPPLTSLYIFKGSDHFFLPQKYFPEVLSMLWKEDCACRKHVINAAALSWQGNNAAGSAAELTEWMAWSFSQPCSDKAFNR